MRTKYFHESTVIPLVTIDMPADDSFTQSGYGSGELIYRHIALNKTLPVGVGDVMSMTEEEIASGVVFDECNVKVSNLEILSKRLAILRTRTGDKNATIDSGALNQNTSAPSAEVPSAPQAAVVE